MDFECDPPREWRAKGLPTGWDASASRDTNSWPWHITCDDGNGTRITVTGTADSEDGAKAAIQGAFDRVACVFSDPSPHVLLDKMEADRDEWKAKAEALQQRVYDLEQAARDAIVRLDDVDKSMRKMNRENFERDTGRTPEAWLTQWRAGELLDTTENNHRAQEAAFLERPVGHGG